MAKADEERARRLAEALRENLKRRKEQARAAPSEDKKSEDARGCGDG